MTPKEVKHLKSAIEAVAKNKDKESAFGRLLKNMIDAKLFGELRKEIYRIVDILENHCEECNSFRESEVLKIAKSAKRNADIFYLENTEAVIIRRKA